MRAPLRAQTKFDVRRYEMRSKLYMPGVLAAIAVLVAVLGAPFKWN